jgi:hypothetical protein
VIHDLEAPALRPAPKVRISPLFGSTARNLSELLGSPCGESRTTVSPAANGSSVDRVNGKHDLWTPESPREGSKEWPLQKGERRIELVPEIERRA